MKFSGKPLVTVNSKVVQLKRGEERLPLLLSALPPGWQEQMQKRGLYNFPDPPRKPRMENRKHVKNKDTGELQYEEDRKDPAYQEKFATAYARYQAVKLAAHLRLDSSVCFDAQQPATTEKSEVWLDYGDELAKEVYGDAGFTDEEVSALLEQASKLQADLDIDGASDSFLSQ